MRVPAMFGEKKIRENGEETRSEWSEEEGVLDEGRGSGSKGENEGKGGKKWESIMRLNEKATSSTLSKPIVFSFNNASLY